MAPDDVLEDLADVLALVEHAEHGVDGPGRSRSALDQLDELVDDGSRLDDALVVALDRQLVAAQADRAAQAVAEGVEDAVADARQLGGDVVGERRGFPAPDSV